MQKKIRLIILPLVSFVIYISTNSFSGGIIGSSSGCSCHGPANASTTVNAIGWPASFVSGQSYPITIIVSNPNLFGAGFSANVSTGTISNNSIGTQLGGVDEISHTTVQNFSSGSAIWTFTWTAPTSNNNATLSIAGNAVDLDGGTNGDSYNTITLNSTLASMGVTATVSGNTCSNGNATITANANNGNPPYEYSLNGGNFQTSNIFNTLVAGSYSITAKDANNVTASTLINIALINGLSLNVVSNNIKCFGQQNGFIDISVTGGTPNYTYSWQPNTSFTSPLATNLAPGTYTINVTDANGCSGSISTVITQPASALNVVNSTSTNNLCFDGQTATANVVMNGGTPPYNYNWLPSGGNSSSANQLGAGGYTCTVTDSLGCIETVPFNISQGPSIITSINSIIHPTCFNFSNGSVGASATGGVGAISYVWNPGSILGGNLVTAPAGVYTFTARDANNCTATVSVNLTQPLPLQLYADITPPNCKDSSDGTATIHATGSIDSLYFNWLPNNLPNDSLISAVPGNYTVTVSNASGCTNSSIVTIPNTVYTVNTAVVQSANNISALQSNATSYQWLNCDSNFSLMPFQINPVFSADTNGGNFAVAITNGTCVDTSICVAIFPTKVLTLLKSEIQLIDMGHYYLIKNQNTSPRQMELFNIHGQLIDKFSIIESKTLFKYDYMPGLYILKGKNISLKFLI